MPVTKLVPIGNSRGVRLPKTLIENAGLDRGEILIAVKGRSLVLTARKPNKEVRVGWEEDAARMPPLTADEKAWLDMPNDFDSTEWEW